MTRLESQSPPPHVAPSPQTLADLLTSIGYTHPAPRRPTQPQPALHEVLEWAFALGGGPRTFLEWLCEVLGEDECGRRKVGVLEKVEVDALEELKAAGLVGDMEDLALNDDQWESEDEETEEEIRAQIAELEASIRPLERTCEMLQRQRENLSNRKTETEANLRKLRALDDAASERLRQAEMAVDRESMRLDATLKELVQKAMGLVAKAQPSGGDGSEVKHYLFQCTEELAALEREESVVTDELLRLFENQFGRGSNSSHGSAISDSDPSDKDDEIKEEMERLISIFPVAQKQNLESILALTYKETKLKGLQERLQSIGMDAGDADSEESRRRIESYTNQTEAIFEEVKTLIATTFQPLWTQCSELEIRAPVLDANYDAKLERQKAVAVKLENFTTHLVRQYARQRMILGAFSIELDELRHQAHVLESIVKEMESMQSDARQRMAWMSQPQFSKDAFNRRVLDSRDTLLLDIKRALECPDDSKESNSTMNPDTTNPQTVVLTSIEAITSVARDLVSKRDEGRRRVKEAEERRDAWVRCMSDTQKELMKTLRVFSVASDVLVVPKEVSELEKRLRARTAELQPRLQEATMTVEQITKGER
ncbi:hypothetical protein HK104_006486 [Borealophlyctis nickersoniae]|nr:hypothetical protein HK104_006486 [Borealophlyctis nickersoniae]